MPGDLLDHLDEGDRVDLAAVEEGGEEQPEEGGVVERVEEGLGEPPLLLGALAQIVEERGQRAGPLEGPARVVRSRF